MTWQSEQLTPTLLLESTHSQVNWANLFQQYFSYIGLCECYVLKTTLCNTLEWFSLYSLKLWDLLYWKKWQSILALGLVGSNCFSPTLFPEKINLLERFDLISIIYYCTDEKILISCTSRKDEHMQKKKMDVRKLLVMKQINVFLLSFHFWFKFSYLEIGIIDWGGEYVRILLTCLSDIYHNKQVWVTRYRSFGTLSSTMFKFNGTGQLNYQSLHE